ncbi:histamine receptor H3 [Mytilus galloprovincialis]|uniref:Histamine receptor H3 n=1 Tax=Mytilus galloprovincialis TaxID=29158 RepID=A0A8B6GSK6_MYTGA|nr:histamine receptor H3 [Mytilus galloprovincialis]
MSETSSGLSYTMMHITDFSSKQRVTTISREKTMYANITTYNTTNEVVDNEYTASRELLVIAGIVIVPVIVITLIGNILTIISFIRDRKLHESINIYILNLAIADLLIGIISMPIYLAYTLDDSVWIFGYQFCKAYLLLDLIFTSVSLEVMILISFDRYIFLKHWSRNYKDQTRRNAYIRSGAAWIIALVLNGPATLFWDIWTGENSVPLDDCEVQYRNNYAYTVVVAIVAFPIPFVILTILNTIIFWEIRKLLSRREKLSNLSSLSNSRDSTLSRSASINDVHAGNVNFVHLHRRNSLRSKEVFHTRHGKKAAKSLAILTVVYVCAWLPYATAIVIYSFCRACVSVPVFETCTWLLWFKSAINPFLYAYNCNRFRSNFKYFLSCGRRQKYIGDGPVIV